MAEHRRTRKLALLATAIAAVPMTGCVTVSPPDKPIEINLNVKIEQEVLVRLQRDVEQIIRENPQDFPQQQTPGSQQ